MMKQTYVEMLKQAKAKKRSVAAFNVVNKITAKAAIMAAQAHQADVITQMSASVVSKLGIEEAIHILKDASKDASVNVGFHLDHCVDVDFAKACIQAGFQSVMFDGSHLSVSENTRLTKEIVDFAKDYDCSIEGEVGVISGIEDGVGSDYGQLASFEDTIEYMHATNVDVIAPAIGTAHGIYKGKPNINFDLIDRLAAASDVPICIHGGTGLDDAVYKRLVALGGAKINISTALKHAYLAAIATVANNPNTKADPLKIDEAITLELSKALEKYVLLFKG